MSRAAGIALICAVAVMTGCTKQTGLVETYQLDNGLTVLLRPVPGAEQVAVVTLFDLGGEHDPGGKSGMAHLMEHLYCTAGASGDARARFHGNPETLWDGIQSADRHQLKLDGAGPRTAIQRVNDADMENLAASVFSPAKRVAVIVEVEKRGG